MNLTFAYRDRSAVVQSPAGLAVALAPNLRRDRVGFDATLRHPLRFREAVAALHDIVINDLRYKPTDRSAHDAYLAEQKAIEAALRSGVAAEARRAIREAGPPALSEEEFARLDREFNQKRHQYWSARQKYANHLMTPRSGTLAAPDALRPGHHRRARRPLLRMLQRRRVELRLPDRRSRGVRRRAGRQPRHDERRLLLEAPRALSAPPKLPPDAVPGRPERLRGRDDGTGGRLPRGEDRPARDVAPGVHAAPVGDEPADAPGLVEPRGAVQRPGLPQAAQGRAEPAGSPVRADAGASGGDRPGALGSANRAPRPACTTARSPRRSASGAATGSGRSPGSCRCSTRPRSTCSATACPASGRSGWGRCGSCWASPAGRPTTGRAARPWRSSPRRSSRAATCRRRSPPASGPTRRRRSRRSPRGPEGLSRTCSPS